MELCGQFLPNHRNVRGVWVGPLGAARSGADPASAAHRVVHCPTTCATCLWSAQRSGHQRPWIAAVDEARPRRSESRCDRASGSGCWLAERPKPRCPGELVCQTVCGFDGVLLTALCCLWCMRLCSVLTLSLEGLLGTESLMKVI